MDLEATIVERLQELRKWQIEQQEKLLKQQHEQRELLSIEQERMFEALGLKEIVNESAVDTSSPRPKVCHSPVSSPTKEQRCLVPERDLNSNNDDRTLMQLNIPALSLSSSNSFTMTNSPRRSNHSNLEYCDSDSEKIETPRRFKVSSDVSVEGIEPLPTENKPLRRSLAIDDMPVPSPKKDFKTLLEERLRESEAPENANEQRKITKKPFLKKGEGLARFKPAITSNTLAMRPRSASLSAMGYTNPKSSKSKDPPKTTKSNHSSRRSVPAIPPVSQQKLNLKAVPPPKKKVRSKSLSAARLSPPKTPKIPDKVESNEESNPSDLDSSKLETKMFEYLEEKADNSSFCSTSSAVLAFMQQSTPLKLRSIKQKLSTQTSSPSKTHKKQESPVRAIRETVVKKDIVFSKWDSGPFDDKTPNHLSDLKQIIGSQQTNTKILLYQNNNNIEKNDVNDIFDISCSTMSSMIDDKDDNCNENKEANVSMHVRFSEYNEYKTIGLTDTSMLSSESQSENYRDEKEWSEHSASSESSDVEAHSRKNQGNIDDLSQTDYVFKYPSKPMLPATMQPRNLNNYDDSTDHSTDDEHSVLNDTEGTYYDEDNTITELQEAVRRTMESYNAKVEELSRSGEKTPTEELHKFSEPEKKEEPMILKSELLKTRLIELEREIEIFRKENAALADQREKLREERRVLLKEMKEKSDSLEKDRTRMENGLQEEKKRLVREKAALENRLRDAREKSIQTKQERQEVQVLKEQLDDLRSEINEKEMRWQAAQARQKSQMRVLQMENSKLKQELEKLQASRRGNAKLKRPSTFSNTKAIHQINRQLDGKRSALTKRASISEDEEILPRSQSDKILSNVDDLQSSDTGKIIVYEPQKIVQSEEDIAKKRNMYQELLKEATVFKDDVFKKNLENSENEKIWQKENTKASESMKDRLSDLPPQDSQSCKELKHEVLKSTENIDQRGSYQQFVREVINPRIDTKLTNPSDSDHRQSFAHHQGIKLDDKQVSSPGFSRFGRFTGESEKSGESGSLTRGDRMKFSANESELTPRKQYQYPLAKPSDSMTPRAEAVSISHLSDLPTPGKIVTPQAKQQVREVQHPDGYTEYWYPNGNVKKVYPDRNMTKLIYYNGDVRETTEEGCIKYFYAATKTWHTTYPDGFEILEFPDGQEERRTTDGVVEVSFPDGSIRLMQPDGIEKWALPDGTIAETFPNGEKILSLPNGQREIHTKEHKRREYPDGTVKYVYPDGTQETRYANGRIRIKDKDGNLMMDSHQA